MENKFKDNWQEGWFKDALCIGLLIFVSFFVYFNSLWGDYLIDDIATIQNNARIHDLGRYFAEYFRWDFEVLNETVLAFIWHLAKGNPFGYHLYNIILHTICVVLAYALCVLLFKDRRLSFFASLIFAIHPIHTEAVSWISGRPYLLSSIFLLSIFISYLKAIQERKYYLLCLFLFSLGLLFARETLMAPFIIIAYELIFGLKRFASSKEKRSLLILLIGILSISILILVSLILARSPYSRTIFRYRGWSYLVVVVKAFSYYLKILYLPLARGLYHPFAFTTLDIQKISPLFFVSVIILAVSIFAFLRCKNKFIPVSFGIMWFFITYLPYSNLIPICNIISERYLYLSSLGICIVLAALFLKAWDKVNLSDKYKKALRYVAIAAMVLFLSSYATLTLRRNYEYHNIITYWWTNINNFPDGYIVYNNLAGTFYAMGDLDNALSFSYTNLMANSNQAHVWCNLGRIYRDKKDFQEAINCYKNALEIDKNYLPAKRALIDIESKIDK